MEQMLGQKMRPPIVLAQFLTDYKHAFNEQQHIPKTEQDIQQAMQLLDDDKRFQSAVENCSLEQLYQCDDTRVSKFVPGFTESYCKNVSQIPNEALQLQLFKKLLRFKETAHRNPFKRSNESYKTVQLPAKCEADDDQKLEHFHDLLLTIRVYRPARAIHVGRSLEKPVFAEEFECLGSNYLTELRNKISCICNKKRFFDISEHPSAEFPVKATDPGYFFITDTFYNDKCNAANADYSETIRTWARRASGLKGLQFKVANMEETRFIDLTVSLGFPQLYQHHGNCEHVFTFSQIELLTPATTPWHLTKQQYPRLRSLNLYNKRLCHMCGSQHFAFIVEHSNRQLHDPAYLCAKCFYSFHYVDGKKIGEFKAYRVNEFYQYNPSDLVKTSNAPPHVSYLMEAATTSSQRNDDSSYLNENDSALCKKEKIHEV